MFWIVKRFQLKGAQTLGERYGEICGGFNTIIESGWTQITELTPLQLISKRNVSFIPI